MKYTKIILGFSVLFALLSGCENTSVDSYTYTLYSNHPTNNSARFHEATFDTQSGSDSKTWADNNLFLCQRAADSIQKHYSESTASLKNSDVKFWCEKGRYKK